MSGAVHYHRELGQLHLVATPPITMPRRTTRPIRMRPRSPAILGKLFFALYGAMLVGYLLAFAGVFR